MRRLLTITFIAFTVCIHSATAQCNPESLKDKCVGRLAEGFTFIKSYNIEPSKVNSNGEIEYSFVFSKGTQYMLTISDATGNAENIEIILYDPHHKQIVSNYNKKDNKFFPVLYTCTTTGVYYMTFKYHGSGSPCGISVLGFKR